jgi:hypothetical protein
MAKLQAVLADRVAVSRVHAFCLALLVENAPVDLFSRVATSEDSGWFGGERGHNCDKRALGL